MEPAIQPSILNRCVILANMKLLERVREHPLRYVPPCSMTLARPVIGAYAVRDSREGKWGRAGVKSAIAWATDLEGILARWLNATSKLGAVADPVADGLLRAESLIALAPEMPVSTSLVGAIEIYNLNLNTKVQKNREKPYVPNEARVGTVIEGAGVVFAIEGVRKKDTWFKSGGKAAMLGGAGLRTYGYWKEAKRMHNSKSK
jgi:hypothetical protein